METELYRMNPEIESSSAIGTSTNRSGSPADQSTACSTNVQSQDTKLTSSDPPPDHLLLDSPPVTCSSFSTTTSSSNHQTSLPCSTACGADPARENGEFATADLEFGGDYSNLLTATALSGHPSTHQATTSLSQNNNLLDKVDSNSIHSAARSCSPPTARSPDRLSSADRDSLIDSLHRQLATPPSASPKLDSGNSLSAEKLSRAEADDCLTEKLTEQLKEQLAEHLNQQLISQQLEQEFGQQIMNQQQQQQQISRQFTEPPPNDQQQVASSSGEPTDEETGTEEEWSSEEEVAKTVAGATVNSKKRSRGGPTSHLCSKKKRRKQSNPARCDFEPANKPNEATKLNPFNQLSQHLNQQLKQLLTDQLNSQLSGIEQQSNLEQLKSQLHQANENQGKKKQLDEEEQEEGLVCKFPNAVSGAASATARFFLANHQAASANGKSDAGESQINYTYYLAAAAAVATSASLKGTKHCLNYCKECCCPFLSTEHEKQYRQLEKQAGREAGRESGGPAASQQPPNNPERTVFAQQLQNLVQQSKLMQEMESVFGSSYEAGQLPQRNAIDTMQLIKQLESGQLDNEEAKVHQQQLASLLLNTNMLSVSNSNQTANPLSALLAGRIFNPDAYCSICKKEFCNKYFLKTHMANKHGIQDQQSSAVQDKCISPTNNLDKYFLKAQQKQKGQQQQQQNEPAECSNQKSPVSASPKQPETTSNQQQQLQYELMNAITASEAQTGEDAISHPNSEQHQKEIIRNQSLALQQMLSNASQLQQISAVMQAEQFANILRNSIVQPPNTNNPSDLSSTDLAKLLNSNNSNFFFTPERLCEMGVKNPEAFCEICLKEFCNKYFLKTHKANKHGIQMDEDELGANSSNSCDSKSNHNNDQNTDKSNKELCNLNDDESLEPGQCQSSINPMDLTALLMINNYKQQQQTNLLGKQQLANSPLNQQLGINQPPRNSKDSPLSLNTSINKVEQESMDFRVASKAKLVSCDLCAKSMPRSELEMHRLYVHKIFAKEDQSDKIEHQQQQQHQSNTIDRNNNSNNEENVPKELTNSELTGLDLSHQQSILELKQKDDILKFQQLIKELQSNSEIDLEQAIFKRLALMQRPQQMAPKLNEEISQSTHCDFCDKEFRSRTALRNHNCPGNENNRLSDSPSNSMFSNISAQMANTILNNSNNSTLNYAMNGDTESLVNQKGKANKQLNISSNGRDTLMNNLNMSIACSNQPTANRLSPGQSNPLFNLQTSLPPNTPYEVAQSIFGSDKSGITLDPNNKQPKFVAGRNYCNLCAKELCNKYFMKTHMMKMHNINIDEHPAEAAANSIVGGVMCDLCKKELCSKYFLKVHKQNTHGIYEDGCIPVTNPQQVSGSTGLMTTSSTVQSGLPSGLVSTQSSLSPNTCISSANGLMNQSAALNPLLSNAYERAGLNEEKLQQLQLELSKHPNLLGLKNGNSIQQANFLEQSNTPISFGTSTGSTNSQPTTPLNGTPISSDKELFFAQGIDPADITNRYFNQCTEICPFCKRRFKSIKWMKTHIANEHPNLLGSSPCTKNAGLSAKQQQQQSNESSDKMRCIFCTRLFSDSGLLHYHLVNDHRNSLEEMIMATGMDLSNNFGAASEDAFGQAKTNEQSASGELMKNEALLNEMLSKNKKQTAPKKSPTAEQKLANKDDELADDGTEKSKSDPDAEQHQQSGQYDIEEQGNLTDEKQPNNSHNLTNILQLMRKHQNGGTAAELSGDEEQLDEEDEESISEEERFAAMLSNNPQLQQLLLSSSSTATQQPSTSATDNAKSLSIYQELMAQQPATNQAHLSPSNDDNPPDSELSDYERFSRAMQQHQLLQQLKQDQVSTRLVQQQQQQQQHQPNNRTKAQQPSRGSNSVYTKLYQCNICEYNTRWLSNLYAHEKRRHNTCSSSSGNLKVITIRRDIPSPNASLATSRANAQLSLNSLLNGLDGGKLGSAIPGQQNNLLDSADLISKLNDFNNNPTVGYALLQPNDPNRPTRPIKERTASGDGQFVCHICNRTYRHKHSLQRHLVCHRNLEGANSSSLSPAKTNQDQLTANFKQSDQSHSPSNELMNGSSASGLPFAQPPSNGTSTPSLLFNNNSTGRSSVDSVNSGEHSLRPGQVSQACNQLANQMFGGLNQEMLESFLISSGSNSTLLGNLIAGSSSNVHSPNTASNAAAYSSSASDSGSVASSAATATASNSAAMFSV